MTFVQEKFLADDNLDMADGEPDMDVPCRLLEPDSPPSGSLSRPLGSIVSPADFKKMSKRTLFYLTPRFKGVFLNA